LQFKVCKFIYISTLIGHAEESTVLLEQPAQRRDDDYNMKMSRLFIEGKETRFTAM